MIMIDLTQTLLFLIEYPAIKLMTSTHSSKGDTNDAASMKKTHKHKGESPLYRVGALR